MSGDSPESNMVRADFHAHRKEIARQNSPFGPVIAGLVEVEIPTEPTTPTQERWRRISYNSRQLEATSNFDYYDF